MNKELLQEIDNLLCRLEDYTHGQDGKDITIMRKKVIEALSTKGAELEVMASLEVDEFRKIAFPVILEFQDSGETSPDKLARMIYAKLKNHLSKVNVSEKDLSGMKGKECTCIKKVGQVFCDNSCVSPSPELLDEDILEREKQKVADRLGWRNWKELVAFLTKGDNGTKIIEYLEEAALSALCLKTILSPETKKEEEAVKFAEWLIKNDSGFISRKELYQIFKAEDNTSL